MMLSNLAPLSAKSRFNPSPRTSVTIKFFASDLNELLSVRAQSHVLGQLMKIKRQETLQK